MLLGGNLREIYSGIDRLVGAPDRIREGAGIAFQPSWMVTRLLERKELVRLFPRWSGPSQTVHLVYPARRTQPMRVRVMLDLLDREIRAL